MEKSWGSAVFEIFRDGVTRRFEDPARRLGYFFSYCVGCILGYAGYWLSHRTPGFPWGGPGDFATFYTGAQILRSGQGAQLYDLGLQAAAQGSLLGPYGWVYKDGLLPYIHPPFFAALLIPFTWLPLPMAFHAWNLVSAAFLLVSIKLLLNCQGRRSVRSILLASLIVLAFFPVFQTLHQGQSVFLVLFGLTLAYLLIKQGHEGQAGVALAIGLIKPQLVFLVALVLLYKRRWRALATFAVAGGLLAIASWILLGNKGVKAYIVLSQTIMTWNGPYSFIPGAMANLRGTVFRIAEGWEYLGGTPPTMQVLLLVSGILSIAGVMLLLFSWKGAWRPSDPSFDLRIASTIVATLLLSPYLYGHDMSLLVLAAFLTFGALNQLGRATNAEGAVAIGHCAFLFSFFFGRVEGWVQIVMLAMVTAAFFLNRVAGRSDH